MTDTASSRPHPLLRNLSLFLFGIILFLAACVWYLQTQHAFRHILVPLVAAVVPGELRVSNGSLTFPATLELTGLSYQQPEVKLSLQIDRLLCRISVMAWLREHLLFVEELDLENGNLHMALGMTPPSQGGKTAVATDGKTAAMVPFVVQRARLDHVTLSIQTGSDEFTVQDLKLAIDDVVAGRTGTIDLQSNVALNRSASQSRWAGVLRLNGTLEESPGGEQLTWTVSNSLAVQEWPGQGAVTDSSQITLDQAMSGRYDFTQATMHADSSLTLRQGETSLGDVSLTFTRTESPDGTVMDLGMKLQKVTDNALSLMLGTDKAFRLHSANMRGGVNIHAIGERYDIRSVFIGQQLQSVSEQGATPPVDVDVAQAGTFHIGSRTLTLDILDLRVAEGDHVLLAGELKHSLTINLGTDDTEHKGVSTQNAPQADWVLTIDDIGVAELRQWCDVFGWKGLRGVRTGQLVGTVLLSGRDNGNAIDLNTRLMVSNVRMVNAEKHTDRTSLKFAHEIQGTVTNLTVLRLHSWTMTASVHDRSVGALRLSGALDLRTPTRDPRLEGSLTLTGLPGGVCNPLLALWSDARIDRAFFNGTIGIKMTEDLLSWEVNLHGDQISLQLPEMHQPTAPLDLVVAQSGSFNRTTRVLRLDKGILRELERSRPVITAVLDKPIRFTLSDKGANEKTLQSSDGQVGTVTIQAHHIGVNQLRPRLAIWGVSALNGVKTGIVDGRWIIRSKGGGTDVLSLTGTLDVTDLRLDAGAMRISTPVGFRSRIAATITEFSHIGVEALNVEALAGAGLIAKAGLSGEANVADGSTDLVLSFNTDSMAKLLDRIGLLDERQRIVFTGGRVSAEGRLRSRGQDHPISAQATIHARELQFQPLQGQFLTYSLLAEGTTELNAARTSLKINKIDMALKSKGKAAGTLTLAGTWPIVVSEQSGAITVVTKDLDAAPLVDVFGVFPGREHGPLPVSADVSIARDSASGKLVVRGWERLGPIRVARKGEGGKQNEATLHIEHDLNRQNDEIRVTALTVTADRPGGRPDHMTAGGTVRIAGQPGAQLKVEIASLDAAWHEALFSRPEPVPQTSANQAVEKDREGRAEPSSLAFLANLDAEMSIGSVTYHTLMIGPGRVIAKGTGDRLEAKLEPTVIADGRVDAIVTLVRQDKQTQLTWSGKGQGLNVESIMQAAGPGREAVMKGTGSFVTSGTGFLNEEPFRKHLSGIVNFNVADGQFIRAPLLQFLSKYTHIKELEQMGFDAFQGNVRLEEGWIHADSLTVTGSLASLEGNASASPDDAVDGRIFVKIGPSLANRIKIPCMSALLKTSDGFMALPFAVRVNGSMNNPTFSPDTAAWHNAKGGITSLADTMKNLLRGCREARSEESAR